MHQNTAILVEVSAGEFIDKLTILEIKASRIEDAEKLRNVRSELRQLEATRDRALDWSPELAALAAELRSANESLWEIEDAIRDCERRKDFGARFIELARAVYRTNDRRCEIKRGINRLLGSRIMEEKSYEPYR